jgi:hypothetical protein
MASEPKPEWRGRKSRLRELQEEFALEILKLHLTCPEKKEAFKRCIIEESKGILEKYRKRIKELKEAV